MHVPYGRSAKLLCAETSRWCHKLRRTDVERQPFVLIYLFSQVGIHLDHPFHTWFVAAVVPVQTQGWPEICFGRFHQGMKTGFSRTQTQAFVSFMLTPLVALKLMPPESRTTPDAPKASGPVDLQSVQCLQLHWMNNCVDFQVAKQQLDEMGPISDDEKVFLFVMLGILKWFAQKLHVGDVGETETVERNRGRNRDNRPFGDFKLWKVTNYI